MTPFQFAKMQKIRDFKVDFGNFYGALLTDSLKAPYSGPSVPPLVLPGNKADL